MVPFEPKIAETRNEMVETLINRAMRFEIMLLRQILATLQFIQDVRGTCVTGRVHWIAIILVVAGSTLG